MNSNSIRQLSLILIVLFTLAACSSGSKVTMAQTSTPIILPSLIITIIPVSSTVATATPCLGLLPVSISTRQPWIYGEKWDELTVSSISIKVMSCAAPQEIVYALISQRFEKLKIPQTNSKGQQCSLEDYIIDPVVILTDTKTPQYDIVASVGYKLKPGFRSDCGWILPQLWKIDKDGWITTQNVFGVYRENGSFRLILLNAWGV